MNEAGPKPAWPLALFGLLILMSGALLAHMVRTSDGISVRDIRFAGTNGKTMSALLYVPAGASPNRRASCSTELRRIKGNGSGSLSSNAARSMSAWR